MSQESEPIEHIKSDTAAATKKRPRWKVRLILILTGLVVGTISAELTLRFLQLGQTPIAYEFDPQTGVLLRPHQRLWQKREGSALVTTNSHGFRDREHRYEKPAGTFRIAVLGDSYAEAVQVELEETFWSVLQTELQKCLPDDVERIEVLNFGISGFGTAQELQMLRHYVWQYDPDMVLLAFLPANDIRNNSRELEPDHRRPFFTLEQNQLVLDDSFRQDPEVIRSQNSSWLQFKNWLIRNTEIGTLIYRWRHREETPLQQGRQEPAEAGLTDAIYLPTAPDEAWRDAWDVTEKLIEQMHREVSEKKLPFLVMSVTSAVVVNPEPEPRAALRKKLGVDDLFHPDRWIERIGRENGFPVVLLSEAMQAESEKTGTFYHGFPNTQWGSGHWNAQGHRFAGEHVGEVICQLGLLRKENR